MNLKKPWEGRFHKDTDPQVELFTASLPFDYRLAPEDILGSLAHVDALVNKQLITPQEGETLKKGLEKVQHELLQELEEGTFYPDPSYEDIHMYLEKKLTEKVGEVGGKLHTGRSRNDQVALDFHLYLMKEIKHIRARLLDLQRTLIEMAENHLEVIMPGYTHLQRAQPVLLSHHLMAYFWMLQRDRERLEGVHRRTDLMPLGAGALAGSGFPFDTEETSRRLGFSRTYQNSIDAVSDRDFVLEFLSFASINVMHLSRFCEEIVLWCSSEFGFLELDDAYTTGSSIMPQKKNPDVAELIRGKTGRVFGNLVGMLTVLKGLPLTYNKDLQEDKEGLFDTVDTLKQALPLFAGMLRTARVNREKMQQSIEKDFSGATDLADHLVKLGVPFRQAHGIVGRMVAFCEQGKICLADLSDEQLQEYHPSLVSREVKRIISPRSSIEARTIHGGTATAAVERQLEEARRLLP